MKRLDKKLNKIIQIMSWTHLSEDERKKYVMSVLSDTYDLGHADGYAEGHADGYNEGRTDGYREGFNDGW